MAQIKIKRTSGSSTPTGLTFGEPAFVQGLKSLYIGQTGGDPALRIGAEVSTDGTFATNSDNKLPTEKAVKTYVDNNVAAGAVASLSGLTGAVFIGAGTAISVAASGKGITLTNTGVQSAVAGSGISVSGSTGAVTISNTGVTGLVAGTAISVSSSTGNITVANTGVQSLTGTSNQITVSGATGAVTLSLPSTVTVPGALNVTTNLTVTGNLTVNGTTTTVNSDVMTVDDPIIVIGLSGGVPISASDGGKDRGIAFTYFDGSAGRTGFFGYDASADEFVFQKNAIISSDVATGNTYSPVRIGNSIKLVTTAGFDTINAGGGGQIFNLNTDFGGELVASGAYPNANGYILKSNTSLGSPSQPTWIDPNSAGFTAFTSTNVLAAADTSDTSAVIAFLPAASATNQGVKYNSGLTYNAVTNSVSATTFVGALSGNATTATTATNATNVAMLADSSDTSAYVAFVNAASDTNQAVKYNSGLIYNASTNALTATTFVGALSGNANTASTLQTARNIGLTGDVSGSASFNGSADINITATIAANSVALGTDTTGNYVATISSSSTGLNVQNSGAESAAVTINFATITSGLNMGTFSFATGEFTNASGTVSLGVVDGGSY